MTAPIGFLSSSVLDDQEPPCRPGSPERNCTPGSPATTGPCSSRRWAPFYADAHLPGAINIPPGQVERLAPALVPDRAAAIVVYCTGSCSSADAVARLLEELGYTTVAVYAGGKEDWVEHGLPVERSDALDPQS